MRRKPCDRFAHVSALDQGGLRSYGLTYRAERCEARAIASLAARGTVSVLDSTFTSYAPNLPSPRRREACGVRRRCAWIGSGAAARRCVDLCRAACSSPRTTAVECRSTPGPSGHLPGG